MVDDLSEARAAPSASFLARHWQKLVAAAIWLALVGAFLGYSILTRRSATETLGDLVGLLRTPVGPLIYILIYTLRPLAFFSTIAGMFICVSLATGASVLLEFLSTGLVPRLPTAVLAMGLMLSALLALSCGFILDTVTRGRREMKRLAYLQHRAP